MSTPWTNQRVDLVILQEDVSGFSGLFGYSPSIGAGNLIFSLAAVAGIDPYGNAYPAGLSLTGAGGTISGIVLTGVTIQASTITGSTITGTTISGGTVTAGTYIVSTGGAIWIYATGGTIVQTFTSSGTFVAPAGVTHVKAECWGAGGGGASATAGPLGGGGGGGGEYSAEASLVVTPGNSYSYTVGAAGAGGTSGGNGGAGSNSTMPGDSVTVTGHGGSGGQFNPLSGGVGPGGPGGTGSTNTTHHDGGAGGTGDSGFNPGGGGGSSAGPSSAGNAGAASSSGGTGGTAVSGGGPGGNGGLSAGSPPTSGPGGGGGAAEFTNDPGGAGFAGQVQLTYTSTAPQLIGAWTGISQSDPLAGVAVSQGLTTRSPSPPSQFGLNLQTTSANEAVNAFVAVSDIINAGVHTLQTFLSGAQMTGGGGFPDIAGVKLFSSASNASGTAAGQLVYVNSGGSVTAELIWNGSGLTGPDGSTWTTSGISMASGKTVTADTWHAPSSLGSNWVTGSSAASQQPVRFRLTPDNCVEVIGIVHTTSASPAATIWTFPAGYIPSTAQRLPGVFNNNAGTILAKFVTVDTSGNVQMQTAATATSQDLMMSFKFPLS